MVAMSVCWHCRDKVTTQAGLLNVLGALYASVLFFAVINALIVQPVLAAERAVSYRERAAGMYSFWPWTLALVSLLHTAMVILVHAPVHPTFVLFISHTVVYKSILIIVITIISVD